MELAEFHAMICIRKLFGLSICFVLFLGPYPKEVTYLLVWGNRKKGRDSKPMETLVDIIQGKLSRKVSVTLETLITKDVHGI